MRTLARTRKPEQELADLAARQYGVVARGQLLRLGLEPGAIGRRLRGGRLHRLHPGVYAVGHRLIPREGRWMAAVLASGPDAVLSHWSAAALWGIRASSRERIDITVSHRTRSSPLIHRHISSVPDDERTLEEGIPVTTVPRTIFDLAAPESADVIQNLLREAEHLELWDRLSLRDLIERYPARRGVRTVRLALERLKDEPAGRKHSPWRNASRPSYVGTASLYLASTTGSPSATIATKSTATGPVPGRSSSSTGGRATEPVPPSAKTALVIES
jgi:predicted transcriptional regulator of viral defense system